MPIEYRLGTYRGKVRRLLARRQGRHRITLGTDSRAEADRLFADFLKGKELAGRPDVITVAFAWDGYRNSLGGKPAATTMVFEWKAIGAAIGRPWRRTITEADCLA